MRGYGFDPFGEEREQPPMSAEMFGVLVTTRLRGVAGITVEGRQGLALKVRVHDRERVAHLDLAYQRYRAAPGALTPIVQQFINRLLADEPELPAADAFEQVAPRLRPWLITSAQWEARRETGVRLVVRPLVQDLGVGLVLDRAGELIDVQLEDLALWRTEISRAYGAAYENLEGQARGLPFSEIGEGEEKLLIDRTPDGFAAVRGILPARLEDWSQRVEGNLVIGLPTRDFVIGLSSEHPRLEAVRAQVAQDARTREGGLYPEMLIYRNGQLELLG